MMRNKQALINEIDRQAHYPTGGDPYIHSFFQTLLQTGDSTHSLVDLLAEAQNIRNRKKHYLTKAHAVYLPLHIINYIMIFLENQPDYIYTYTPSLLEPAGWRHLIDYVMAKYPDVLNRYLQEKDVQQNISQRGISIPFYVHTLLHRKNLKVADLGCSANFVWGSLMIRYPFKPLADATIWKGNNKVLSSFADKEVTVRELKGIDHHYPLKNDEGKKWLLSCRHPREVKAELIEETKKRIEAFENIPNIQIREGDFYCPDLPKRYFDIVTMNNTLYQLPDKKRHEALEHAANLLHPTGLLVIQDNCRIETGRKNSHIVFTDSRKYYTYRSCIGGPLVEKTFGRKWLEVFRFRTTRCKDVIPGKDFNLYMKTVTT